MADCHDLFSQYHETISITPKQKDYLRTSRNAIREDIKTYFSNTLGIKQPKFYGQGSYMMGTMVNPINGEYDIDDGVYLQHLTDIRSDWPTPDTVHKWVLSAVKDRTSTPPEDKNTCVRVIYRNQYHIDLPIYSTKEDTPFIANKKLGWQVSDPRAMTDWFGDKMKQHGPQLSRLVKYLKAWSDYQYQNSGSKAASGLILTILATERMYKSDDHDDEALIGTVKTILDKLKLNFSVTKPVQPYEELFNQWSDSARKNLLEKFEVLRRVGAQALTLEYERKEEASLLWRSLFGERFPKWDPPKKEHLSLKTAAPAVLGTRHERSA